MVHVGETPKTPESLTPEFHAPAPLRTRNFNLRSINPFSSLGPSLQNLATKIHGLADLAHS